MTLPIDRFRANYFLRDIDPDFCIGRRTAWIYALPSRRVEFARLNPGGPEPVSYLEFAQRDLGGGTQQGAINALGNAKRAVHLAIDSLLGVYCLAGWRSAPFPVKAELLRDLGALPVRMASSLNRLRNLMEHEYTFVEVDQVADFVELAELVLFAIYPFFKHGVTGTFVAAPDGNCIELAIDPRSGCIETLIPQNAEHVDFSFGRVHYNIEREYNTPAQQTVPLTRERQAEWMPILDLFVYCTRREMLRLRSPTDDDDFYSYTIVNSKMYADEVLELDG